MYVQHHLAHHVNMQLPLTTHNITLTWHVFFNTNVTSSWPWQGLETHCVLSPSYIFFLSRYVFFFYYTNEYQWFKFSWTYIWTWQGQQGRGKGSRCVATCLVCLFLVLFFFYCIFFLIANLFIIIYSLVTITITATASTTHFPSLSTTWLVTGGINELVWQGSETANGRGMGPEQHLLLLGP